MSALVNTQYYNAPNTCLNSVESGNTLPSYLNSVSPEVIGLENGFVKSKSCLCNKLIMYIY